MSFKRASHRTPSFDVQHEREIVVLKMILGKHDDGNEFTFVQEHVVQQVAQAIVDLARIQGWVHQHQHIDIRILGRFAAGVGAVEDDPLDALAVLPRGDGLYLIHQAFDLRVHPLTASPRPGEACPFLAAVATIRMRSASSLEISMIPSGQMIAHRLHPVQSMFFA